jgi:hypothetical protein
LLVIQKRVVKQLQSEQNVVRRGKLSVVLKDKQLVLNVLNLKKKGLTALVVLDALLAFLLKIRLYLKKKGLTALVVLAALLAFLLKVRPLVPAVQPVEIYANG